MHAISRQPDQDMTEPNLKVIDDEMLVEQSRTDMDAFELRFEGIECGYRAESWDDSISSSTPGTVYMAGNRAGWADGGIESVLVWANAARR